MFLLVLYTRKLVPSTNVFFDTKLSKKGEMFVKTDILLEKQRLVASDCFGFNLQKLLCYARIFLSFPGKSLEQNQIRTGVYYEWIKLPRFLLQTVQKSFVPI